MISMIGSTDMNTPMLFDPQTLSAHSTLILLILATVGGFGAGVMLVTYWFERKLIKKGVAYRHSNGRLHWQDNCEEI